MSVPLTDRRRAQRRLRATNALKRRLLGSSTGVPTIAEPQPCIRLAVVQRPALEIGIPASWLRGLTPDTAADVEGLIRSFREDLRELLVNPQLIGRAHDGR